MQDKIKQDDVWLVLCNCG